MRGRWRAHHPAKTFDSKAGGHGAKSAFAILPSFSGFEHPPDLSPPLFRKRMLGEPAQRDRDLPQFVSRFAARQLSGLSQRLRGSF
jgi:hypothetical protein